MVQLSIINPQHILPTFARLKFLYAKYPILDDFNRKGINNYAPHGGHYASY